MGFRGPATFRNACSGPNFLFADDPDRAIYLLKGDVTIEKEDVWIGETNQRCRSRRSNCG